MEPNLDIQNLDFIENDLISRMAEATSFREWWSLRQQRSQLIAERDLLRNKSRVQKSDNLSDKEITEARALIALYNKRHRTATQIIKALQRKFGKLASKPDAARVFWTETKKADTDAVQSMATEYGFDKFKIILSPSACAVCRKKTDNGTKIFKNSELNKSGYGHKPPFHPNCYCILVPHAE